MIRVKSQSCRHDLQSVKRKVIITYTDIMFHGDQLLDQVERTAGEALQIGGT